MAQLFCQLVPRHAGWLLVGPPAATSLAPQQDITVTFADGTSVVVPAGTPAALLGGGTTWDRTKEVVVGYVLAGSGTLLACPEAQLSTLGTDYAPLARVLADSVQVYQTQQGGGHDLYVQAAAPAAPSSGEQATWIDTSSGPPYVQNVWRSTTSTWDVLQMDATGYPLPDGARLDEVSAGGPASNSSITLWDARDGPLTWIDATTYALPAGSPVTIATQLDVRVAPVTLTAIALDVPTPIPTGATFSFAVYSVPSGGGAPVQLAQVNAGTEIAGQSIGYNGWPGVILPTALTLDFTPLNYILVVEITGSQWGRAGSYYGFNSYVDSSNYYVAHSPNNLNDVGFNPSVFTGASTDSATGIDIAASFTAPPDLLRLVHADGTLDITHDRTTCHVMSAGADVLVTPLPGTAQVGQPLVGALSGSAVVPGWSTYTWRTVTTTYTMTTADYGGILADATGAAFTVTLPSAVGATQRFTVKKKDASANAVTVAAPGTQTIDGTATYALAARNNAVTVESDGTNWYVQSKV